MSHRLVRKISTEISTTNTDMLLYTVPNGNTLIVFKKKIETTGGGSTGDAEAVFKEEIVSGNKQVCAVVNGEELVKERYEAGTSIYVNAASSCTASLEGILFGANMAPMQDPNYVPDSSSSSDVPDSSSSSESGSSSTGSVTLTAPKYDENDWQHTTPIGNVIIDFTPTEEMSNGYPIYQGTVETGDGTVTLYLLNKTEELWDDDVEDNVDVDFWAVLESPENDYTSACWVKRGESGPLTNGMVLDGMGYADNFLNSGNGTITLGNASSSSSPSESSSSSWSGSSSEPSSSAGAPTYLSVSNAQDDDHLNGIYRLTSGTAGETNAEYTMVTSPGMGNKNSMKIWYEDGLGMWVIAFGTELSEYGDNLVGQYSHAIVTDVSSQCWGPGSLLASGFDSVPSNTMSKSYSPNGIYEYDSANDRYVMENGDATFVLQREVEKPIGSGNTWLLVLTMYIDSMTEMQQCYGKESVPQFGQGAWYNINALSVDSDAKFEPAELAQTPSFTLSGSNQNVYLNGDYRQYGSLKLYTNGYGYITYDTTASQWRVRTDNASGSGTPPLYYLASIDNNGNPPTTAVWMTNTGSSSNLNILSSYSGTPAAAHTDSEVAWSSSTTGFAWLSTPYLRVTASSVVANGVYAINAAATKYVKVGDPSWQLVVNGTEYSFKHNSNAEAYLSAYFPIGTFTWEGTAGGSITVEWSIGSASSGGASTAYTTLSATGCDLSAYCDGTYYLVSGTAGTTDAVYEQRTNQMGVLSQIKYDSSNGYWVIYNEMFGNIANCSTLIGEYSDGGIVSGVS